MDTTIRRLASRLILIALCAASPVLQCTSHGDDAEGRAWSEWAMNMAKMHADMGSVQSSGGTDVDFARLMVPHHQFAIEMARTELLYGKDPAMRRLAQEIVADQQSEIELMSLWLKQHGARFQKSSAASRIRENSK